MSLHIHDSSSISQVFVGSKALLSTEAGAYRLLPPGAADLCEDSRARFVVFLPSSDAGVYGNVTPQNG